MKKRSYSRRKRDELDSNSSSSLSDNSPQKPEDLFSELKSALVHNDRYIYRIVRSISKLYKSEVGILRITIAGTFTLRQHDIEEFFRRFGKIQNVIIKQSNSKTITDESQNKNKNEQQQAIAYVIYYDYFAAILALKVLNSVPEKERIVKAKLCCKDPHSKEEKLAGVPMMFSQSTSSMMIQIEQDNQFAGITDGYKYVGTIGVDLSDKHFRIKERILGVEGCNFIRIYYLCEKSFKFEKQGEESRSEDLELRLIINKTTGNDRNVLVMSNCLPKYNQAIRFLHELLEQIVEEYKNSREKSAQIIAKDIHITRWQKFAWEPQLKFLT